VTFRSYAQNFEDVILWRALKDVANGFYIDIGAWDPVADSVSMAFYAQGWRGVHVEPIPSFAERLRAARPDEVVIEAALSDKAGEAAFFAIEETGLSTGVERHAQRHEQAGHRCEKIVVPCRTLASIFEEIGEREVHWMKIDVEGMEREVLSGWGTAPARPWILVIESTLPNSQIENFEEWEPLVLERGYAFVYFDGLNRYYVHAAHAGLLTGKIAESEERAAELAGALSRMQAMTAEAVHAWQLQAEGLRAEIERAVASTAAAQERDRQHETALAEKDRALEAMSRDLAAAVEARARLEGALDERSHAVADKELRLSEASATQARIESVLEEKNRALVQAEIQLTEALAARAQLEGVLEERNRALTETSLALAAAGEEKVQLEEKVESLERDEGTETQGFDYDERVEMERHIRALESQYQDMTASTSWRVTAPLRFVSSAAITLRARLRAWLGLKPNPGDEPPPSPPVSEDQGGAAGPAEAPIDLGTESRYVRTLYHRLIHARDNATLQSSADRPARPRLAYLSPLSPVGSGFADAGADLLAELSNHYDIDLIVQQAGASNASIAANCNVRDITWFEQNAYVFDRILYQIGNSRLHGHLLPLLERFPGVVILHDFFLGQMLTALELDDGLSGSLTHALLHSHGYPAVSERFNSKDLSEIIEKYPANLAILQHAQGVIVPSERWRQLAEHYYGEAFAADWVVVPHRRFERKGDEPIVRRKNGGGDHDLSGAEDVAAGTRDRCSPSETVLSMRDAIEKLAGREPFPFDTQAFAAHVNDIKPNLDAEADWLSHARKLAHVVKPKRQRRLYIDVSDLARQDFKTGIQRVVKSQLIELFANPPPHLQVEPVYAKRNKRRLDYYHARGYVFKLLGMPVDYVEEEPIDVLEGDVFFAADFYVPGIIAAGREGLFSTWRKLGMRIYILVHDLLPIKLQEYFPPENEEQFTKWLSVIVRDAHGLVCTTRATAEDVRAWVAGQKDRANCRAEIFVCPPGADFKKSIVSRGLPRNTTAVLNVVTSGQSFLSVGTIEPRKGYDQTLRAFELLWAEGARVNLVIVGKKGWMVDDLAARLRDHPQAGRRLFWLEAISDEYLERIYAACTCLIAASEGEGFGLPLIEAARHNLPILARGIPVFREIAGECALYFAGKEPEDLVRAIRQWQELYADDRHPKTQGMRWLTWQQSIDRLKAILLRNARPERPTTNIQPSAPHVRRDSRARLADDHGAVEGD